MRRTRIPRIVNTSFNISPFDNFNHNIIYPNVIEPFVPNINEIKPTIEITEINSDESENKCPQNNTSPWSSVKSEDENKYKVKGQTKGKRNITHEHNYTYDKENQSEDDLNETFNSHCGGGYDKGNASCNRVGTLTLKNNNITSDTSSDDQYDDIKIIHFNDNPWDFNSYEVTDHDEDINKLICSLKDVKYSFENDYEVSNMSFDDSTSSSTDDDEIMKDRGVIPTPIFNWIPKLNLLSSPLPTVTELTEPYRHSSPDITEEDLTHNFVKKSANSWFDEKSNRDQSHHNSEILRKLSTLSQREKRRNKVANILNKQTENKEQVSVYIEPEFNSTLYFENVNNNITATDRHNITETINKEYDVNEILFDARCNSQPTARPTQEKSEPIEKLEESYCDNNTNEVILYDYDIVPVEKSDKQSVRNEESNLNYTFVSNHLDLSQNAQEPNSIPFLQLSFDASFDENKSCFRRFFKFINCCK